MKRRREEEEEFDDDIRRNFDEFGEFEIRFIF